MYDPFPMRCNKGKGIESLDLRLPVYLVLGETWVFYEAVRYFWHDIDLVVWSWDNADPPLNRDPIGWFDGQVACHRQRTTGTDRHLETEKEGSCSKYSHVPHSSLWPPIVFSKLLTMGVRAVGDVLPGEIVLYAWLTFSCWTWDRGL